MAFDFSLATVLRVRGLAEEREERLLQRILHEIETTRQAIADTDLRIAHANAARRSSLALPIAGADLQSSYAELQQLKQNRSDLETQLDRFHQLRLVQVNAYSAARRDRELLTDMQSDQRDAYDLQQSRREQRLLDDTFASAFSFRRNMR